MQEVDGAGRLPGCCALGMMWRQLLLSALCAVNKTIVIFSFFLQREYKLFKPMDK